VAENGGRTRFWKIFEQIYEKFWKTIDIFENFLKIFQNCKEKKTKFSIIAPLRPLGTPLIPSTDVTWY
jgi:hypothetical protein